MRKLTELVLYIAAKSQDDSTFSTSKLNKILFSVDFLAYGTWGRPVTEITYVRQEHGPAPKPDEFLRVRETLISAGRATIQTRQHLGSEQKRIVALADADMSLFDQRERRLIDDVIEEFKSYNAAQLTDWSYTILPWLQAENDDEIPFHTVFALRKRLVSRTGLNWGERRLNELRESHNVP